MSKLFKLKEWLTIREAANHLSGVLQENLTENEVLGLGISKHLRLSVHFPYHMPVRKGKIKPVDAARKFKLSDLDIVGIKEFINTINPDAIIPYDEKRLHDDIYLGARIGYDEILDFEEKITTIKGTFDLLNWIGLKPQECLSFSKNAQSLLSITLKEGICVQSVENEEIYQLQDHYECEIGSPKEVLEKDDLNVDNYCPMIGLPQNSILVIRTAAVREFEQSLQDETEASQNQQKLFKGISNNSFLEAVGLMAKLIAEHDGSYKKQDGQLNSQAIADLVQTEANKLLGGKFTEKHKGLSNLNKVITAGIDEINKQI